MNERLAVILDGLEGEPIDAQGMVDMQHPSAIRRELDKVRDWIGEPRAPIALDAAFFRLLFGYGREGLTRLFEAFTSETRQSDAESAETWDCLMRLSIHARSQRILGWSLDGKSATAKIRAVAYLDPGLSERLRRVAFEERTTVSSLLIQGATLALAAIEKKHGKKAEAVA